MCSNHPTIAPPCAPACPVTPPRPSYSLPSLQLRRLGGTHAITSRFPVRSSHRAATARRLVEELTPRELQVLRDVAEGLANKEIAEHLHISEHTVKFHVASILGKLHVGSRTEAVTQGIRLGLIPI